MTSLQRILTAVLVVQVVIAAAVFWPRTPDSGEGGPLLGELETEEIVALTLENNAGDETKLVRQDEGWVLAEAGDYPADSEKIDPVLAKLIAINTSRLIARSSDSHERLQVAEDDFAGRIQIEMEDGSTQTLLIGSSPNPGSTHVRRADRSETYLTSDLAAFEVSPAVNNWIDTSYISLARTEIASIQLENDNGSFSFEKLSEGNWTLADLAAEEEFEQSTLNVILSRVTNMQMAEPLGKTNQPEYGMEDPQAVVTVVTEDSEDQSRQTYTLLVGNQEPDGDNFVVKWSDSDYYVEVAKFNVENIIGYTRDDFIKEPPTPTPDLEEEATATPEP